MANETGAGEWIDRYLTRTARDEQVGLEPKDDWGVVIKDQIDEMIDAIDSEKARQLDESKFVERIRSADREEANAIIDAYLVMEARRKVDDYTRHTTPSGVEQLADVELGVDVLGGYPDPLLRLGFDPSVARAVNEGPLGAYGTYHGSDAPWYKAIWGDMPESITRNVDRLNPMDRNLSRAEQAEVLRHEYRHRGYNELRNSRNQWKFDEQLRNIMGEQVARGNEEDVLPNFLEENLNRAFDRKYANTFIKGLSQFDDPMTVADEYPDNLDWGDPEHYPREKETLTEFMNRVEGEARGLLSRRWPDG